MFPLIWLLSDKLLGSHIPSLLMLGFLYLCALPSTISSSVALTGSAGGNVPAAILNASLSSVLGIFLTPLLVSFVVGSGAGGIDLGATLLDLCAMLLLPLVLGQLLRPLLGKFFARHKRYTNIADKLVILLLVYSAFCNSMVSGMWQQQGNSVILTALMGSAILLAIILWMTTRTARALKVSPADEIAAVFCASKKSLAAGAPMAALIFRCQPRPWPDSAADHDLSPVAADRLLGDGRGLRQPQPRTGRAATRGSAQSTVIRNQRSIIAVTP